MMIFFMTLFILFLPSLKCQLDIVTDDTPLALRGACISNPCLHNGMCTVTPNGFICTCVGGYIGINCERRADDCPRDFAINCIHGVCKLDMHGHPRCICNEGYDGTTCSNQIDNCASNPCHNSAKCIDKTGGYDCQCLPNTKGSQCQIRDDDIRTCVNTCKDYYFDGKCWHEEGVKISVGWGLGEHICNSRQTCYNATKGIFNEYEFIPVQLKPIQMQENDDLIFITDRDAILYDYHFVPHILPMEASSQKAFLTCNTTNALPLTKNSSISLLDVNDTLLHTGTQYFIADMNALYRCDFGLRLNVTVKDKKCSPAGDNKMYCNGRGKCYTDFTKTSYQCFCCDGYVGEYCQYEDPCFARPCANNAECKIIDLGSGNLNHECICPTGYHGKQCDKLIDYCQSNPCKNDGACYSEFNGYRCQCKDGFSGQQCQTNDDECVTSPCQNGGKCVDGLNNFKCECSPGFKGTLCEMNIDDCEEQPCMNSTCLDLSNNYTCACSPGLTGRNCEIVLNECLSQPCVNGKCVQEEDGFSCSCGIGYTGMLCELKLDLCLHSQYCITKQATSCIDKGDNVTCTCVDGWSGSNCGVNVDDCVDHKCMNGAKCIDEIDRYSCKCKKGYHGNYCEVAPPQLTPDIEIEFMSDECRKFQNPLGVHHLEVNILALLKSTCKCPLTSRSIQPESSKVICKDEMAGIFQMDLMQANDNDYKIYKKDIICSMKNKIQNENTPTIYHNTYFVNIKDEENLCDNDKRNISEAIESSSSTTGIIIAVILTIIFITCAFLFVLVRLKKLRNSKVGIAHKFLKETSFDNAAYLRDISKDESLDETSFMSKDDTYETATDCPRWADSYDRARKLCNKNRSNIPTGRTFNIDNPGGNSSDI